MQKIEEIYAFLSEDCTNAPFCEGVIGQQFGATFMPFVAADLKRVADLKPYAKLIAEKSGGKIKLVKFITRVEIEEIEP